MAALGLVVKVRAEIWSPSVPDVFRPDVEFAVVHFPKLPAQLEIFENHRLLSLG